MASIEFAFAAEFAKVELNGTLTSVGAGVRGLALDRDQPQFGIFIAGCVNREQSESAAEITVTIDSPDGHFSITQSMNMEAIEPGASDFATTVFAVRQEIPVSGEGKYVIRLDVDEDSTEIDLWAKFVDTLEVERVSGSELSVED